MSHRRLGPVEAAVFLGVLLLVGLYVLFVSLIVGVMNL